ncbi:MAG TPA: ROK family protein [Acidimicrobiales bacterium]
MSVAAGLDIGGTKILGVALDPDDPDTTLAEVRVPTPEGEEHLLDAMAEVTTKLGEVDTLGIGIAGLVERRGVLRVSPNLPGLRGLDVLGEMRRRVGRPVRVHNDADCAAWGERTVGSARGADNVVCVTLGTGIGAGLIADGELVSGAHGFGGEAGHIVVDPSGPPCPCGRWGCWERFASGSGLARLGRDAAAAGRLERARQLAGGDASLVRAEHVSQAAVEGDEQALAVMDTFARWVALGIGNLVTLLDCSLVVVGGGLVVLGDLLLDRVRDAFRVDVMSPEERLDVRIVAASLGDRAGAIGAAMLGSRAGE